jgi:hypothetical protein
MGALSFGHIIILLLIAVILIVPISKILQRAGWNSWLSLLWLIPIVNIAMLWVFAYGPWPALPAKLD